MSLGPLYVLGEVSVQLLRPFFNWIVCLCGVESCEFFIHFGDQILVQGINGKLLSHTVGSLFILLMLSLVMKKIYFDEVPFVYSFLYVPCSRGNIVENIAAWDICMGYFPPYVLL